MSGPLKGLKVVEMAGIGPGPFCAMMLADMGAHVVRVERPPSVGMPAMDSKFDITLRGRASVVADLKSSEAIAAVLDLIADADVLLEGYRPGVMERLGLGPDVCLERNPRLVYGRMTGWGQYGPLAKAAGHDINYIALTGALNAIGRPHEPPAPPLNFVGDYGGGALMLAFGVMCAVHETRSSGKGQVIDAAMTDGAALLAGPFYGLYAAGAWSNQRGENHLDGGAHFYDAYACADGKYVSIGAIEPHFYADLLRRCGVDDAQFSEQNDTTGWSILKVRMADLFRTKTRAEWCAILEGSDACFAPVLDWNEAPQHPHNVARETFISVDGVVQPSPAPRFSRTPAATPSKSVALPSVQAAQAWWNSSLSATSTKSS